MTAKLQFPHRGSAVAVLHELRGAGRAQFDIHSPANTVKEALMFSAELRLEGVDAQQRKTFVNEVRPRLKALRVWIILS